MTKFFLSLSLKKPIPACLLVIILATAAVLATSCLRGYEPEPLATATPTQQLVLDATARSNFDSQVGTMDDMNHGLTLERINLVAVQGFPTPSPNDISVLVLNHATEPIQFANIGFGIQVFEFHEATKEWHRITLPYTPEQKTKILPAMLETYDFSILNDWDFSPDDLAGVTSNEIRIFVAGHGVLTKKHYGAFLDVRLQLGLIGVHSSP